MYYVVDMYLDYGVSKQRSMIPDWTHFSNFEAR